MKFESKPRAGWQFGSRTLDVHAGLVVRSHLHYTLRVIFDTAGNLMKSLRISILPALALFAAGCIFGNGDLPPSLGGDEDASGGANNGNADMASPNNGIPDAGPNNGNNGTDAANNNGTPDGGNNGTPTDMGSDQGPDLGPEELCGNGAVDDGETCDWAASGAEACPQVPVDCSPDVCQLATVTGSLVTCSSVCEFTDRVCGPIDGCCPANCPIENDEDCSAVCGNGIREAAETCDGDCPASCDDGDACTADSSTGAAATCNLKCTNAPITACTNGDGCCPANCDASNDNDCSASCGDGILDAGETCDGDCPTAPMDCDDSDVCTQETFTGSPDNCNAVCRNVTITTCKDDGCCPANCNANNDVDCMPVCGNDVVEDGELCDGNCSTCDDGDVCTNDTMTGGATTCDVVCMNTPKTCSTTSDGCCPMGCNAVNDADCTPFCGNNVVESGETCDGNCPATCDDQNTCTTETLSGDSSQCNVTCTYENITACVSGDGCCPAGCNSTNDNNCSATCGNAIVEPGETCDGNCPSAADCTAMGGCYVLSGDAGSCNAECILSAGCTPCDRLGTCPCAPGEECNNGKCEASDGDGCTNACDSSAFCGAWGGPGYICNTNDDLCYECVDGGQCAGYETCNNGTCAVPGSCDNATIPDDYCSQFGSAGDVCVGGTCRTPCGSAADCGALEECNSGYCQNATSCGNANSPDAWCVSKGSDYCTAGGCVHACASDCDCPEQYYSCQTTTTVSNQSVSACNFTTDCADACSPDVNCQKRYGGGSCNFNWSGYTGECTGYKTCSSTSACNHGFEWCPTKSLFKVCTEAPNCAAAKDPNGWCTWNTGFRGYVCDTLNAVCKSSF